MAISKTNVTKKALCTKQKKTKNKNSKKTVSSNKKIPEKRVVSSKKTLPKKSNSVSIKKVEKKKSSSQTSPKPSLKKEETIKELKEEVVVLEQSSEIFKSEKPKSLKIIFSVLFILVIFGGAFALGYLLYEPIETVASNSDSLHCEYGEWEETEVPFCLVSPDGKYFENDRIIYIYQEETGTCIKKTREKNCSYKEV